MTYDTMRQLYFLLFAVFVFAADQISKWFVMERILVPELALEGRASLGLIEWYSESLERLPYVQIEVLPFFNWVMVWNHGISFGLFNEQSEMGALLLIGLATVIIAWFIVWLLMTHSKLQSFALAMVIGGAAGNALDRVRFEAVVDFLDFHVYGYHWPAFNIGDSAIVIGVFMLMIFSFRSEDTTATHSFFGKPQG